MTQPIALQLYSVREQLAQDFEGTIRHVAAMGYAGVETAGFPEGVSPAQAKALFDELGLAVAAAHAPLPLGDQQQQVLDLLATLGTDRLVCAYLPPSDYATLDATGKTCAQLNEAAQAAAQHNIHFGVHNHWWEFEPINGTDVHPYQIWRERLDPSIFFELDTYWVKVGGMAPVAALAMFGRGVQLLHVKDGPADVPESAMVAVGQGAMDYTQIIPAAASADWLIVELDRCATDMMVAVEESFRYLTEQGLGHGRL